MASLIFTFQDLYNEVAKFLGTYGSSGPSGTDLTDAKDIVNNGYRAFIQASDWSFLKPEMELATQSGDWKYDLPEDFGSLLAGFQFDDDDGYPPLEERSVEWIRDQRATNTFTSWPEYYALRTISLDKNIGTKWELMLYPTPDAAYTLHYRYKAVPTKLESDDDIPVGGPELSLLLREFCLAQAETDKDEKVGVHNQKLSMMLNQAKQIDKRRNPHNLGFNGNGPTRASPWEIARGGFRVSDVEYNLD